MNFSKEADRQRRPPARSHQVWQGARPPQTLPPKHLALDLDAPGHQILPGIWYAVRNLEGVTVSVIAPEHISRNILLGHEHSVNRLGATESAALAYLVAFDLQALDLHFV